MTAADDDPIISRYSQLARAGAGRRRHQRRRPRYRRGRLLRCRRLRTDMLTLARANADQAQITNARFLHGRIENIPLPDDHVDVVMSNCVINLSATRPASWPRPSASSSPADG